MQEAIEKIKEELKSKVGWVLFSWVVTIATIAIGGVATIGVTAQGKADVATDRVAEVEGDIKAIHVDLGNIKDSLRRIEDKLK